eukprot:GFUD01037312.1.p2 GENE.GFUD01037312.1~~GFUD01037312.1.p2  ORF type:complete len:192 (+),score=60.89 GFUD01037312.1:154-729(+)
MAGRGAKFKKYYEQPATTSTITTNIVTLLGTGHRLANLAVAPILPRRENVDKKVVGSMWDDMEEMKQRVYVGEEVQKERKLPKVNNWNPNGSNVVVANIVPYVLGGKREKKEDSVETDDMEKVSVDTTPEYIDTLEYVFQEDIECGSDVSSDDSEWEGLDVVMKGLHVGGEGTKRSLGRGRGRPKYRPAAF